MTYEPGDIVVLTEPGLGVATGVMLMEVLYRNKETYQETTVYRVRIIDDKYIDILNASRHHLSSFNPEDGTADVLSNYFVLVHPADKLDEIQEAFEEMFI